MAATEAAADSRTHAVDSSTIVLIASRVCKKEAQLTTVFSTKDSQ